MYLLRRAALRALASGPQFARPQSTISSSSLKQIPSFSSKQSVLSGSFRRSYASEQRDFDDESRGKNSAANDSFEDTAEHAKEGAQSAIENVAQRATEAAERVKSAVSSGIDAVTPDAFRGRDRDGGRERDGGRGRDIGRGRDSFRGRDDGPRGGRDEQRGPRPNPKPSTTVYVGNLYFEVTEASLRKEFAKFGDVSSVKIIYDGRGLSKGFGYIDFADQAAATEAKEGLDGEVFEGRRLAVQYAIKAGDRPQRAATGANGFSNPPSKTLFIGNMSYEMSDKDLNDLFRGIKNVLDVRVAIDRRTGQPRGFAHADFIDVKSAEAAVEYLQSKEFYGRNLRIDYSANASRDGNRSGEIISSTSTLNE